MKQYTHISGFFKRISKILGGECMITWQGDPPPNNEEYYTIRLFTKEEKKDMIGNPLELHKYFKHRRDPLSYAKNHSGFDFRYRIKHRK